MNLPKITVITPSFNQGQFLEETLFSIVSQRYPNLELILIDGGSTDNSVEVIKKFADQITYWVSEKDSGQTNAINKGLAKATGDIVAILNSDDTYLPGALDFVGEQFAADPSLKWMTAPSLYFGPSRGEQKTEVMIPEVPDSPGRWLVRQTVAHPSTFLRKELHDKYGPFDESFYFGMDYEYWCRLAFGGEKCRTFRRPLSGYRMHGDSKSVSAVERKTADMARILEMYGAKLSPLERAKIERQHQRQNASNELYQAVWLLIDGNRPGAMQKWMNAVRRHPDVRFTKAYWTTGLRILLNKPPK